MAGLQEETEAYLAKIKATVKKSRALVEQAELRLAETDRLLEQQGLTREAVRNFRFTPAQRQAVNAELERRGLEPIPEEAEVPTAAHEQPSGETLHGAAAEPGDAPEDAERRRRRFSAMMHAYRL